MAEIARKTGNFPLFSIDTPSRLTVFGNTTLSTDIDDIVDTNEFKLGWGYLGGTLAPPEQDFNALGYSLSYVASYYLQKGIPEWDGTDTVVGGQEYIADKSVVTRDGSIYISLLASGGSLASRDPSTSPTYWKNIDTSSNAVLLTGNQTIAGIKTFTSFPITPSSPPLTDYQMVNKKYADDLVVGLERVFYGTAVNSTSGTAIDFTGLPLWAKEIEVIFKGVNTSGYSNLMVQLGSTAIQNTGYSSSASLISPPSTVQSTQNTTGFHLQDGSSGSIRSGSMILTNITGNVWVEKHVVGNVLNTCAFGGGNVTLSGVLDRFRVTSLTGTDTFYLGQINYIARG